MAQSDDDYGGPAILSRGESPGMRAPSPVNFRPYVGLSGVYDTGLTPVSVDSGGNVPNEALFGVELNLGAYGFHSWKRTTVGLDYRGNFRHYSQNTYYDGSDHFLTLSVTHQASKHITLSFRNMAGTYSRNYYLPTGFGSVDPGYLQVPQNELYDNRVIFLSTSGDVTYHKSARLSFNFGGEGNLVRRRSSSLYGITGYSARSDASYRFSRHVTAGLSYNFTHFDYTRAFGSSDVHSVGVTFSDRISRHAELSILLGGSRVESENLTVVLLDPAVAALLGQTTGVAAAYHRSYVPNIEVRLSNTFPRSMFQAGYSNRVSPGNGVILTARQETAEAGYTYTGIRYWNLGVNASYSSLSGLIQTFGKYRSEIAGIGITRQLGKSLHGVLRVDGRHYDTGNDFFRRTSYRVSLGVTFAPGDVPLALW